MTISEPAADVNEQHFGEAVVAKTGGTMNAAIATLLRCTPVFIGFDFAIALPA